MPDAPDPWQNEGGDRCAWLLDLTADYRAAVYWDGGPHDAEFPFGYVIEDRRTGKPVEGYNSGYAPTLETAQYCAVSAYEEGPQEPFTMDELPF